MFRLLQILLLLLGGWIIWFFLRQWYISSFTDEPIEESSPPPSLPEKMVRCATCGVHIPEGEAIYSGEATFCCQAHQNAAQHGEGKPN